MKPKPKDFEDESGQIDWEEYESASDDWGDAKYEQMRDERDEKEREDNKDEE